MTENETTTKKEHPFAETTLPRLLAGVVIVATLLVLGGGWFAFLRPAFTPQSQPVTFIEPPVPHAYDEPNVPIENVALTVVYFISADRVNSLSECKTENWIEEFRIEEVIEKISKFHEIQFEGNSKIVWRIVSSVVVGQKTAQEYSGQDTNKGNPRALLSIREELETRITSGDITLPDFSASLPQNAFPVLFILYEDVGASGMKNALLLSCSFMTNPAYHDTGPTILWHELGHALGFPGGPDHDSQYITNEDIMGGGRDKPIAIAYVSDATKAHFGIKKE